jgi:hypothetical protein
MKNLKLPEFEIQKSIEIPSSSNIHIVVRE